MGIELDAAYVIDAKAGDGRFWISDNNPGS
jgi:hypothetical protein